MYSLSNIYLKQKHFRVTLFFNEVFAVKGHKLNQESSKVIKCHIKGDVILGDTKHQFA